MRKFFAILIAEFARALSQTSGRGSGSALPGLVAQKIDPAIITKLSDMLPGGIILVTGTNGKTTSSKMIAGILEAAGHKVIYNFSGSNLARGIASFLIQKTNFWGTKIDGEVGLFEVDEATMPEITALVNPKLIVVTNLFRDQLDRYGEVDKTAAIIEKAMKMSPGATLLLNADDPLVASLGNGNEKALYFGLKDDYKTKSIGAIDSRNCLVCGHELTFSPRYFGHLGNYKCPNCGLTRPKLNYAITDMKLTTESSTATFAEARNKTQIQVALPGLYNLYNALTAAAVADFYGIPGKSIAYALSTVTAAFGRMEKVKVGNKSIFLMLVKNPTGFTQTIETLTFDDTKKHVLIALNDNFADGTDISWIWDAEMEILRDNLATITVSGIRAEDMLLRFKYAGFNTEGIVIEKNLKTALDGALDSMSDGETLYILPTYTAMLDIRRTLAERNLVKGFLE
jgi:lipid II isoglutaminyl synthase (glutamine-hydrolysing)